MGRLGGVGFYFGYLLEGLDGWRFEVLVGLGLVNTESLDFDLFFCCDCW